MQNISLNHPNKNKYIIDLKNYKVLQEIKRGGYGSVLQVQDQNTGEIYAAKVLNNHESSERYKKMVNREISIMIRLQHPTIIKLIGYSLTDFKDSDNVTMIMQFSKKGSLSELISNSRKGLLDNIYDNTTRQIILIGIARGMMLLHKNNTIHRDLKPDNILLDDNLHPLITDFGLSKICDTISTISHSISCGTSVYMAPEVIAGRKYNGKADVYSFGILMYEVITDLEPYPLFQRRKIDNFAFSVKVIQENYRPEFTIPVKGSLKKLIEQCWSGDPNDRPTFEEIFKKLAYNIEDSIYDISSQDDEDDDDVNKFYLEGVDADEIMNYVDDLNENSNISFNSNNSEDIEKVMQRLESIEKENELLKKENDELRKKYDAELSNMKIKNEQLTALNNEVMKWLNIIIKENNLKISNTDSSSTDSPEETKDQEQVENNNNNNCNSQEQEKMITIRQFNSLSLKEQQEFIDGIIKSNRPSFFSKILFYGTNPVFDNINKLLLFLMNFVENSEEVHFFRITANSTNHPFDCLKNGDSDKNFVFILSPSAVETLYNNKVLNSSEFINLLKQFSQPVSFELRYPFDLFYLIFEAITNIKKVEMPKLRISLIINEFKESNQTFMQNKVIEYLTFNSPNSIGKKTFYQCSSLRQILFNKNIKKIDSFAFFGCTALRFILNLDSVESIGESAFENCAVLHHINLPSTLTEIGDRAFAGCLSITSVTIPDSVQKVGKNAFAGCSSLTQIFAPSSLQLENAGINEKATISRTD